MSDYVPKAVRKIVRERARGRCEYCLLHEDDSVFSHQLEHTVARKHRGTSTEDNLAWSCFVCNEFKGTDLASIDMENGRLVPLFNPRQDRWSRHFRLDEAVIVPLTAKGRVTEYLLQFNLPKRVELRQLLIDQDRYPG